MIEELGLAPAWVAGNSFGASITLRLAAGRPDVVRGIIGHEPPLFALLDEDAELSGVLEEVGRRIADVVEQIWGAIRSPGPSRSGCLRIRVAENEILRKHVGALAG